VSRGTEDSANATPTQEIGAYPYADPGPWGRAGILVGGPDSNRDDKIDGNRNTAVGVCAIH